MNVKTLLFWAISLLLGMFVYFLLNPSYEKSLEAKYYFEVGEYEKAYERAQEAFSEDIYNRMASTIMAQSKIAMKYQKYIQEAKKYMQEINAIAQQDEVSDADKAKIKLMSEIMIDGYKKLAPSVITDKTLVKQAREYYEGFVQLHEKVTS